MVHSQNYSAAIFFQLKALCHMTKNQICAFISFKIHIRRNSFCIINKSILCITCYFLISTVYAFIFTGHTIFLIQCLYQFIDRISFFDFTNSIHVSIYFFHRCQNFLPLPLKSGLILGSITMSPHRRACHIIFKIHTGYFHIIFSHLRNLGTSILFNYRSISDSQSIVISRNRHLSF